jgi:hypothetical protein
VPWLAYSRPGISAQEEAGDDGHPGICARHRRGAAASLTGEVGQGEVVFGAAPSRLRATVVSFTPGARTAWDAHPIGQVLFRLFGVGVAAAGDLSGRYGDDPAQCDALASCRTRPPVRAFGDV